MRTCPNGHGVADDAALCPTCGSPLATTPARPEGSSSKRRTWLILAVAVVAIAIAGLLVAVAVGGNRSVAPLTAATARDALISERDLTVPMATTGEPSPLTEDMVFAPKANAPCTTVIGVSRLTDIDPGTNLGTPVFPSEARGIEVFEGVNFEDTSEDYISTVKQRIMVFPDSEQAAKYMTEIENALAACPDFTINSEGAPMTLTLMERQENVSVGNGEISWTTATDFKSQDADGNTISDFAADKGKLLVQRGPNVLVAHFYRSQEDPTPIGDFEASLQAAKDTFLKAVG